MGIDPGLDPVTLGLLASSGLGSCHGTVEGRLWVLSGIKSRTNQCPQLETWLGHANDLYGRNADSDPLASSTERMPVAPSTQSGRKYCETGPPPQLSPSTP
jgi:hypothetical protein